MNKKFKLLSAIALSSMIGAGAILLPACSAGGKDDEGQLPDSGWEEILPPAGEDENQPEGGGEEQTPEGGEEDKDEEPAPPQQSKVGYIAVIGANVNIRSGAGTEYSVLGQAKQSTLFAIVGKIGNWYITYYNNKLGYIYSDYCQTVYMTPSEDERVENVISDATKLLGVKYVYGAVRFHDGYGNRLSGFSVYAFDCSSLMQYAFKTGADYNLQVTTRTQVKQGKTVAASQLKRGDLMFFTNATRYNNTGVERIGHVALYLGDNYILHTASEFAKIEKISTSRWNYYIQSQRIF